MQNQQIENFLRPIKVVDTYAKYDKTYLPCGKAILDVKRSFVIKEISDSFVFISNEELYKEAVNMGMSKPVFSYISKDWGTYYLVLYSPNLAIWMGDQVFYLGIEIGNFFTSRYSPHFSFIAYHKESNNTLYFSEKYKIPRVKDWKDILHNDESLFDTNETLKKAKELFKEMGSIKDKDFLSINQYEYPSTIGVGVREEAKRATQKYFPYDSLFSKYFEYSYAVKFYWLSRNYEAATAFLRGFSKYYQSKLLTNILKAR